jgi:hypothetical protein
VVTRRPVLSPPKGGPVSRDRPGVGTAFRSLHLEAYSEITGPCTKPETLMERDLGPCQNGAGADTPTLPTTFRQTMPWSSMASATFTNPAMLAPCT